MPCLWEKFQDEMRQRILKKTSVSHGGDSGNQDFDLTTDFLIIFSRISFAEPISSPVHTSVVASTATIL